MRLTSFFECMFIRKNRLESYDVVVDVVVDFGGLKLLKKFRFLIMYFYSYFVYKAIFTDRNRQRGDYYCFQYNFKVYYAYSRCTTGDTSIRNPLD